MEETQEQAIPFLIYDQNTKGNSRFYFVYWSIIYSSGGF